MTPSNSSVLAVGEVLWDCFPDSRHLGGAPLNFTAHVSRLGHRAALLTAVGNDLLGSEARALVQGLGIDMRFFQVEPELPTGVARVRLDSAGVPAFEIPRPAAFDAVRADEATLASIAAFDPRWLYFGSLFAARAEPEAVLHRLFAALPGVRRFCDINLRPGCIEPSLIPGLLSGVHVLKLSEEELAVLAGMLQLPAGVRDFCSAGAVRYGWHTVAVTRGAEGCIVWQQGAFVQAPAVAIEVADTVGAGDAFSAALLHGVDLGWPPERVAAFANRVGALVASRPGAIPDWTLDEAHA